MAAKLLFLLALASSVPTIDVQRSCRGAQSAALPEDRAGSYQRCIRDELSARHQLLQRWRQLPVAARGLCSDESTGISPSYVELLTCLEMQAGGNLDANMQTQAKVDPSPSATARVGEPDPAARQDR